LLLARGRDATSLFESYHPFSERPREVRVGKEGREGGREEGTIHRVRSTVRNGFPRLHPVH
jgi:hypothetical protein